MFQLLDSKDKITIFGGASRSSRSISSAKKTTRTRKTTTKKVATPTPPESMLKKLRYSNWSTTTKNALEKSVKSFFYASNSSLALSSTINQTFMTAMKYKSAGSPSDVSYYDEKMKLYLKPYFSVPTMWTQSKVSFGTPWYF